MSSVRSTNNGGESNVLDNLNPHKFTSQIPIPSQSKRRNSTSTSLTDMINKSTSKNPLAGTRKRKRATDAGEGATNGFRLSQRYSSLPSTSNTNHSLAGFINRNEDLGLGTSNTPTNRDPRPLRDRNFQNAIQREIFDYLSRNKYDVETNNPISLKFLKQPTQKGFVIIFKWLYLRLDPGYIFLKSFEHEVYQLLRTLQYPYLETINKSQISAVGGSSWPKFLGMLHWLVRTNLKLDRCLNKLDQNIVTQNTQELTILNHPLRTLDEQDQKQEKYELMVEKLFIEYVTDSYKSFLRLEDNYSPYMEELQIGFNKFTHIIETDINNLATQNDDIYLDCEEMAKRNKKIGIASAKFKALKSDLIKFQNYVDTMEYKRREWPKKLEKMRAEHSNKSEQIINLEAKVQKLRTFLAEKGVSIEMIDEKTKQKEMITSELDAVSDKLDHLVGIIKSEKHDAETTVKNMMITVRQYNSVMTTLINSRNERGDEIDAARFRINISESLLHSQEKPLEYENIFSPPFNIKETLKRELLKLYQHIEEKVIEAQKENSCLENHLIDLKEQIDEKTNLIGRLEMELSEVNSKYELTKQESESNLLSQKIDMEKLKQKIQDSRNIAQKKIAEAQMLVENTKLEYEEMRVDIKRQRVLLHKQVIDIIEHSSSFKINIQGMLEKTENDIEENLKSMEQD